MSHTAGPWEWIESPEGYGYSALVGADNAEVLVPGGINDGDCPITWMGEEMTDDDKDLIAEAGTVHHETGLTPCQLAAQRDELLRALRKARRLIYDGLRDALDKENTLNSINTAIANARREP